MIRKNKILVGLASIIAMALFAGVMYFKNIIRKEF